MKYQNRDSGIENIHTKNKYCSGMGLGVILLDETYPGFPGDVRNPSAFSYPIQYEVAMGLDCAGLIYDDDKEKHLPAIEQAALKLEKMGCRAILAECGYFAYFQKAIASIVKVPVFLSSLLQVSWAQSVIGPDRVVGLLMSGADALLDRHLNQCGIPLDSNYVIGDVMDGGKCPEFHRLWKSSTPIQERGANYTKAEKDFVEQAIGFYESHSNMGAMVLECTGFPPFARAIQRKLDIPIYSWGTMMDHAYQVTVHRDYYGHV